MIRSQSLDDRFLEFQRTGSPRALAAVFDRTAPSLMQLALHLAPSESDAEDLVQATFVTAIEKASTFDPQRRVEPWLCGILANHAHLARRRARRLVDPERLPQRRSPGPLEAATEEELNRHSRELIATLPEQYQPVLTLYLRHGLTPREIAEALGRSRGTVRSQVSRGLEHLRKLLPLGLAPGAVVLMPSRTALASLRTKVLQRVDPSSISLSGLQRFLPISPGGTLAVVVIAAVVVTVFNLPIKTDERSVPNQSAQGPGQSVGSVEQQETAPEPIRESLVPRTAPPDLGILELYVQQPDGTPASFTTASLGDLPTFDEFDRPHDHQRADENGLIVFENIKPGLQTIFLEHDAASSLFIEAGQVRRETLKLPPGRTVHISVHDPDGLPCPDAGVYRSHPESPLYPRLLARTDALGNARLDNVPPNTHLWAASDGFAASDPHVVHSNPKGEETVTLALIDGESAVEGQVTTPHGEPAPYARIGLYTMPQASWRPAKIHLAIADAQGDFCLEDLGPGLYELRALTSLGISSAIHLNVEPDDSLFVPVTVPEWARLEGTLVDREGNPMEGQILHVSFGEDTFRGPDPWTDFSTTTNEDGSFQFPRLPPGTGVLTSNERLNGHGCQATLKLRPGETLRWDGVYPRSRSLRVLVTDDAGAPLSGVELTARRKAPTESMTSFDVVGPLTFTDEGGVAHFLDLAEASYQLSARIGKAPIPSAVQTIGPEQEDARLTVDADPNHLGSVTYRVEANPRERDRLGLALLHESGLFAACYADPLTGVMTIEDLPPGSYKVELQYNELPLRDLGLASLKAGGQVNLGELDLRSCSRLRVHLKEEPIESVRGILRDEDGVSYELGFDRALPGFLSPPLSSGLYELIVLGASTVPFITPLQLEPGLERSLAVELRPASAVPFRLEMPPAHGRGAHYKIEASLTTIEGRRIFDEDIVIFTKGRITWKRGLVPGTYRLQLRVGDLRGAKTFEVSRGASPQPIELLLQP